MPPQDSESEEKAKARFTPREKLFFIFVMGLFSVLLLTGVAMVIVFIIGDDTVALRLISAFGTMFASLVGLGSGYLVAQSRFDQEQIVLEFEQSKSQAGS